MWPSALDDASKELPTHTVDAAVRHAAFATRISEPPQTHGGVVAAPLAEPQPQTIVVTQTVREVSDSPPNLDQLLGRRARWSRLQSDDLGDINASDGH